MLCARRVVRVVHEGDVKSTPFLAEAHVIVGSAPFLAGQGSAPITLYLSHLSAKPDAGRFVAEGLNQPRRIIRVSGGKIIQPSPNRPIKQASVKDSARSLIEHRAEPWVT